MDNKKKAIRYCLVIIWMAIIFLFSHQPSTISAKMSHGVLDHLIRAFQDLIPNLDEHVDLFHNLVRKGAHFFIYFVLGILVLNAINNGQYRNRSLVLSFVICILYAMSDEYHQTFIPGRSAEMRDVLIDSSGALLGIHLLYQIKKHKIKIPMV